MNKSFVVFFVLAIIAVVFANECFKYNTIEGCNKASACTWCDSAVVSGCVDADFAASLPKDIATCGVQVEAPLKKDTVGNCYDDISTKDRCLRSQDDQGECLWCLAKAVPSVCANPSQAARLPEGVFICGYNATNPF